MTSWKRRYLAFLIMTSSLVIMVALCSCASHSQDYPVSSESSGNQEIPQPTLSKDLSADTEPNSEASTQLAPLIYPTGWLIAQVDEIPAGVPVSIIDLPEFSVIAHRDGAEVVSEGSKELVDNPVETVMEGKAVISYNGIEKTVSADYLLVNMPDVLPQAIYDAVYSYSSTSRCAGESIPGITGEHIPGYVAGPQENRYLNEPQYVVPCAYRTAVKAKRVCEELSKRNLRLLVYDAYRPMTSQNYLSEAFMEAYQSNSAIQIGIGDWPLTWYVANGPSGHNFGTDLDVGVCDVEGNPIPMPSAFDAFDDSGHLTSYQMSAAEITPEAYRPEVVANEGCLALHDAFCSAGFSELASEWWHFGDEETESLVQSIVGSDGLDFVASL